MHQVWVTELNVLESRINWTLCKNADISKFSNFNISESFDHRSMKLGTLVSLSGYVLKKTRNQRD